MTDALCEDGKIHRAEFGELFCTYTGLLKLTCDIQVHMIDRPSDPYCFRLRELAQACALDQGFAVTDVAHSRRPRQSLLCLRGNHETGYQYRSP